MNISTLQIFSIFIISCIAGIASILDESQIHRPLIVCTIVGYIMNDITTGILTGGTLEMIALGWINIGAAIAPDIALASIISTIIIIFNKQSIGSGIAIAVPLAIGGQMLTIAVRTITVFIQHLADKFAKNGHINKIDLLHLTSLFLHAMRIGIPSIIIINFIKNDNVYKIINSVPEYIANGLTISGGIIVVIGYAMIINMIYDKNLMVFFYLGFIIAGFSNFSLLAIGILAVIIAIIYIQLSDPEHIKNDLKKNENLKNKKINDLDNELD